MLRVSAERFKIMKYDHALIQKAVNVIYEGKDALFPLPKVNNSDYWVYLLPREDRFEVRVVENYYDRFTGTKEDLYHIHEFLDITTPQETLNNLCLLIESEK